MLETLLLRNNVIGAAAASAFGPLADGCQELQELDLGENELGAEGVSELVHVLQGCLALRKVCFVPGKSVFPRQPPTLNPACHRRSPVLA